ncbi:MAG: oxidoreductase, partial [Paracoccaceae bacterium]
GIVLAAGWALTAAPALAETTLTITVPGDPAREAVMDEGALLSLPQERFVTSTIWTSGEREFSGPSLAAVLEAVDAPDGTLRLVAANDYSMEMPRAAVEPAAPIVALRIDGAPFSRRDKGPLWLVFPYDSEDRYRSETVYAYSVWQLTGIDVLGD